MNNLVLFLVFTGSAILNLGLAIYGWRNRHLQGATAFGLAMFLFAMLPLAQVFNITGSELMIKVIALKSRVEAAGIGATAWLIMFMQLTGYSHKVNWRLLLLLSITPLAIVFLNWTENPLFRSNYYLDPTGMLHWTTGQTFWFGLIYINVLFLIPLYLLWHSYRNGSPLSHKQTLALSVSTILPILFNLLIQLNIVSIPAINFPFAAGPLMGLIVTWTVYQYRLFDLIPVARSLLIENMSDGVLVVDNHNNVVDINPAMLKLIGMSANAALGENIEMVFAPWPDILTTFRDVNETQSEISTEGRSKQYFDLHISPLYGTGKQEVGRIIVFRDVTIYKQAENQLILQSAALNAAASAIVITDTNDVIQWVNPAFTRLTGYSETEAIGKTPKIIRSDRHEPSFYRTMHELPLSGEVWKGEVINKRKNGTEYFEEQTITPVRNQDGTISHFIAIKQDITKRKQAEGKLLEKEKQMQALNDNLPNGYTYQLDFGIHGEVRQFIFISAGVEKIFGISPQQILDDSTCLSERFLDEDNVKIAKIEESAFTTMTTFKAEARFARENNQTGWMLITSTPRKLANNHTIWDGIALDITEQKRVETELQRTLTRTKTLYDVANTAITSASLPALLKEAVQNIAQCLPANRASLIIFDVESQKLKYFARGGPGADQVMFSVKFDELMEGLSGWTLRTGQSALSPKDVPDPRESEAVRKRRQETNCGSVIVTPLKHQNDILGTLTLINLPEEPEFTEQDVELIEAVAGQISSAIVKVSLEDSLQHQNKYLTTLHQITLDLLNKMDINELLQSIVDRAAEFLDAPYCEIMLYENDKLVVRAYTSNQSFLVNDQVERDEAFLSWKAFDTGTPAIMNNYSEWAQRRNLYDEIQLDAVVSLPIISKQGSVGVLELARSTPGMEFDDFEIQAATLFAQLASLSLENAKLHEAIRQESIRDALTGLFNRRFMQESLIKETSRAKRKGMPLAVVMFDLDHLKEINDTYGHSAGDEVLRNVSQAIKTKIRMGDIACRYGGDEFTLILTDATMDNARQRMEELRKEISLMSIQHEGSPITKFSLSIGVAEYPRNGTRGEELLKAADMALYRAKQTGRNRVMTA